MTIQIIAKKNGEKHLQYYNKITKTFNDRASYQTRFYTLQAAFNAYKEIEKPVDTTIVVSYKSIL